MSHAHIQTHTYSKALSLYSGYLMAGIVYDKKFQKYLFVLMQK